jgi:predicted transcriptional regulator
MKTEATTVRLDKGLLSRARDLAKTLDRPLSKLLSLALTSGLKEIEKEMSGVQRTAFDALQQCRESRTREEDGDE